MWEGREKEREKERVIKRQVEVAKSNGDDSFFLVYRFFEKATLEECIIKSFFMDSFINVFSKLGKSILSSHI